MQSTLLSITEIHRLTGKARSTINQHANSGKLTYVLNDDGKRRIDASEVARVYAADIELDEDGNLKTKTSRIGKSKNAEVGDRELVYLQEQLEYERRERKKECEQLKETIDFLKDDLEKWQNENNTKRLMLEDHSRRGGGWEQALSDLKDQIANEQKQSRQEIQALKELASQREKKLKIALDAERNKTVWQKLFEKKSRTSQRKSETVFRKS